MPGNVSAIAGISGATGVVYGIRLLEILRGNADVQTHLVISAPGKRTIVEETAYTVRDVEAMAHLIAPARDVLYLGRGPDYPMALEGAQVQPLHRILSRDNRKLSDEKSPAGKTDYHTMGACYEVLNVVPV